jgi:hypothetical protein
LSSSKTVKPALDRVAANRFSYLFLGGLGARIAKRDAVRLSPPKGIQVTQRKTASMPRPKARGRPEAEFFDFTHLVGIRIAPLGARAPVSETPGDRLLASAKRMAATMRQEKQTGGSAALRPGGGRAPAVSGPARATDIAGVPLSPAGRRLRAAALQSLRRTK